MSPTNTSPGTLSRGMLDVLIRAGLIGILLVSCYRVFHPFLDLMLWALILAVTLYPLEARLKRTLGKDSRAATAIVLVVIAILLVPVYLLSVSMVTSVEQALVVAKSGSFHLSPPPDSVAGWPVVGKRLHGFWLQASTDLTSVARQYAPQLKDASLTLLGKAAGVGVALLMFIAALIIAGIFMAYGEGGTRSAVRIAERIFGKGRGEQITALCTATIRAVGQGVVGIAFIQMLLIGVGFVLIGLPGAGLLALVVLVFGILQLPATLITVPVIIYVFATQGASMGTVVFAVYVFVAGLLDNVLKPLLLGRGVAVPMPVVLIGALGGMVTGGLLGLFIGPVILAVGYQLFWQWVDGLPEDAGAGAGDAAQAGLADAPHAPREG
ncbi:MAG TPA: AI-2E family transporter [Thermomonas sp.]|nr:AI-2E family transporter [Thermomonas sp.]